ncbi:xanthine dehydrogenase family protein molybdopterin-binding subunit [Massilia sp. PWRC2]|uniref:xanthine dehydrogenase family protein molybdopterin-binding subunit n=1 Tax=Massilia sp. PWRC2 TaxID=2804626 RepID=UPI003CF4CB6D
MSLIGAVQEVGQSLRKKIVEPTPDAGSASRPDPLMEQRDGLVGAPIARIDGAVKVQGQARFAAEFSFDDMLYGALVFSTIARGRIDQLDTAAAAAAPGVRLVMTHQNAPRMAPLPVFMSAPKAAGGEQLAVLQDRFIHWNGQPIAVVLADSQEQADHGATLVRVSYLADSAVTSLNDAIARGCTAGAFMGTPLTFDRGDAEGALVAAPCRVDAVYQTPCHNHNAIEPHAVTVAWQGKQLLVHDASQGVSHTAWSLAHVFAIDEQQVQVSAPFVGGAFGGKTLWRHQVLAAAAAKLAGRPVRLNLSRQGVYRIVGGRARTVQRVALGAQADGHFDALIHTGLSLTTASRSMPEPFILPARCTYAASHIKLGVHTANVDMLANTFMRAPGEAVGSFALESAVDELALLLAIDPIALRLRNEATRNPTDNKPFSTRHLRQAYEDGASRFGWQRRQPQPGARQQGEWRIGMGCATATYPYYRLPGGAARLTLSAEGRVRVEIAAHEMGMGTATVHSQILAERLALPLSQVACIVGDSSLPGVVLAGGSQQSAAIGAAVRAAQEQLFAELLKLAGRASPLAGLQLAEVQARDGGLCRRDAPQQWLSYTDLLAQAGRTQLVVEASAAPPLETQHWSKHSFGAIFCEVGVNCISGEPRVQRLLGCFDCGRILNASLARSQLRSGMIMGIGMALMEETLFDERTGRIMHANLADYHLPVQMDVPEIDVMWTDIADPHTPMGARGIGEIGITGTAAAIANAIYNACGVRVRDLPITLDKLAG